jgi:restriction system protein
LKVNPFVSFRVIFQCKRYDGSVISSQVAEFRGNIPSNAGKGLLITTGYLTSDAKKRAQEPGLLSIELIDGEQLIKLMEEMQLGLKPTYEVDYGFFNDFEADEAKGKR